jgi:fructan beta-fructosidase
VDQTEALWGYLELKEAELNSVPAPQSVDLGRFVDYGPDFYACISFHNHPERRVWLAWMNNWLYAQDIPTSPWRSAMTIPREVTLRRIGDSVRLRQKPVRELASLRGERTEFSAKLRGRESFELPGESGEIKLRWRPGSSEKLRFELLGLSYELNLKDDRLLFSRRGPGTDFHQSFPLETVVHLDDATDFRELTLFYDVSSVELFTGQGTVCHTARTFPVPQEERALVLSGADGEVEAEFWNMNSIWR